MNTHAISLVLSKNLLESLDPKNQLAILAYPRANGLLKTQQSLPICDLKHIRSVSSKYLIIFGGFVYAQLRSRTLVELILPDYHIIKIHIKRYLSQHIWIHICECSLLLDLFGVPFGIKWSGCLPMVLQIDCPNGRCESPESLNNGLGRQAAEMGVFPQLYPCPTQLLRPPLLKLLGSLIEGNQARNLLIRLGDIHLGTVPRLQVLPGEQTGEDPMLKQKTIVADDIGVGVEGSSQFAVDHYGCQHSNVLLQCIALLAGSQGQNSRNQQFVQGRNRTQEHIEIQQGAVFLSPIIRCELIRILQEVRDLLGLASDFLNCDDFLVQWGFQGMCPTLIKQLDGVQLQPAHVGHDLVQAEGVLQLNE